MGALWASIKLLVVSRWTGRLVGAYSQIAMYWKFSRGGNSFESARAHERST